jgi:hypothetical protein
VFLYCIVSVFFKIQDFILVPYFLNYMFILLKYRRKILSEYTYCFEQDKRAHDYFCAYSHLQDNSYTKFLRNIVPSRSVICTQAAFLRCKEDILEADLETSYQQLL